MEYISKYFTNYLAVCGAKSTFSLPEHHFSCLRRKELTDAGLTTFSHFSGIFWDFPLLGYWKNLEKQVWLSWRRDEIWMVWTKKEVFKWKQEVHSIFHWLIHFFRKLKTNTSYLAATCLLKKTYSYLLIALVFCNIFQEFNSILVYL